MKIKIITRDVRMEAELNQSETAKAIWEALPIRAKVNTWGDEIYFEIPVDKDVEDGVSVVQVGDIAYWSDGNCFCIFFGKTPVSTDSEIRPASAVNLLGRLLGNPREWKKVKVGQEITIEKA